MRLNRGSVGAWLEEATASNPLPDLEVNLQERDLLERSLVGLRAAPSFEEHDPGCYLFYVDRAEAQRSRSDAPVDIRAIATQISAAARESHRRLEVDWESFASDHGQQAIQPPLRPDEYGSYIVLARGLEVPTIGPGGHVAVAERSGTIAGSASVRPFVQSPRTVSWISADSVITELAPFFGEALECFPALGYYEGSWMERQAVIRPTLAFIIETDATAPYPQRWVVTMSATTVEPTEPLTEHERSA